MGRVSGQQDSIRKDNILDLDSVYGNSSNSNSNSLQRLKITCAENIPINAGVCISDTGFALLATIQWVDNRELFGISSTNGIMNNDIELYNNGETITIENANFTIGAKIRYTLDKNFTTDYVRTVGNYNQILGTAISNNSFIVNIEEPLRIM